MALLLSELLMSDVMQDEELGNAGPLLHHPYSLATSLPLREAAKRYDSLCRLYWRDHAVYVHTFL